MKQWAVKKMTNTYMRHQWIVTNPTCPEGRHPTRDCGCRVFSDAKKAERYAEVMNSGDAS